MVRFASDLSHPSIITSERDLHLSRTWRQDSLRLRGECVFTARVANTTGAAFLILALTVTASCGALACVEFR